MKTKKVRVFETFAGIGAQRKALDILRKNVKNFDFEIVGTSEWDIRTNISYGLIHNNDISLEERKSIISKWKKENSISDFIHSNNTKTPIKNERVMLSSNKDELEETYALNNNLGSIVNISGEDVINKIGNFDLLTYSFPCQDLSSAGNFAHGNKGMKKGSNTRSGLLWQVERILTELESIGQKQGDKNKYLPKYLLLENVKNMLGHEHIADYSSWLKVLREKGYSTQTYLLNAKNYGIPQSRERVYAISVLNDKNFYDTYSENENDKSKRSLREKILDENNPKDFSKEFHIHKTLEDIIQDDYSIKRIKDEAALCVANNTPSRNFMIKQNPILLVLKNRWKNTPITQVNKKRYAQGKDGNYYIDYTRTITTKQDRDPNGGLVQIPNSLKKYSENMFDGREKLDYRFLTPRETFMLMGFDSADFDHLVKQKGKFTKEVLYRESGNSIVVNVLVSIFKYMFNL